MKIAKRTGVSIFFSNHDLMLTYIYCAFSIKLRWYIHGGSTRRHICITSSNNVRLNSEKNKKKDSNNKGSYLVLLCEQLYPKSLRSHIGKRSYCTVRDHIGKMF